MQATGGPGWLGMSERSWDEGGHLEAQLLLLLWGEILAVNRILVVGCLLRDQQASK